MTFIPDNCWINPPTGEKKKSKNPGEIYLPKCIYKLAKK